MRWITLSLLSLCLVSCIAAQPESARTVAAYEVPLHTAEDRIEFLGVISAAAEAEGHHLDAATNEELERLSEGSPTTIHAAVWRGADDDEPLASVMDLPDNPGRAWISFSRGEDPALATRFRERAMRQVLMRWPLTQSLPIMPTGVIPLPADLRLTPQGYRVRPEAAFRYELPSNSPLIAPN